MDKEIADIARDLARALIKRAHDRQPDDLKRVLELQTLLHHKCLEEASQAHAVD
jgi:hypothetical protein